MQTFRTLNAIILAPICYATGFRFSKEYRWGCTRFHRFVYAVVDTVGCNIKAGI